MDNSLCDMFQLKKNVTCFFGYKKKM